MIWFGLFELLGLVVTLFVLLAFCKITKRGYWSFIWRYFKWVCLGILVVWVIIAIICWRPLYNTTQCYFRGVSMKADTKYSWYLGECQIKTKSGSYVPIIRARALPDGPDGGTNNEEEYSY